MESTTQTKEGLVLCTKVSTECHLHSELLGLSTVDTLGELMLCCGACPVYSRMFGSLPGLYPPDAGNIPSRL